MKLTNNLLNNQNYVVTYKSWKKKYIKALFGKDYIGTVIFTSIILWNFAWFIFIGWLWMDGIWYAILSVIILVYIILIRWMYGWRKVVLFNLDESWKIIISDWFTDWLNHNRWEKIHCIIYIPEEPCTT